MLTIITAINLYYGNIVHKILLNGLFEWTVRSERKYSGRWNSVSQPFWSAKLNFNWNVFNFLRIPYKLLSEHWNNQIFLFSIVSVSRSQRHLKGNKHLTLHIRRLDKKDRLYKANGKSSRNNYRILKVPKMSFNSRLSLSHKSETFPVTGQSRRAVEEKVRSRVKSTSSRVVIISIIRD